MLRQYLDRGKLIDGIYLDEKLKGYLVDVVLATRNPDTYGASELGAFIRFGASPRATISLALASKAVAFHEWKELRHPTGYQGCRVGCSSAPGDCYLRSGS